MNCVAPGGITEEDETFDPEQAVDVAASYLIGRYVRPEDIAEAVLFLSSEHASAITGQTLTVDGGTTVPLQDWILHEVTQRRDRLRRS